MRCHSVSSFFSPLALSVHWNDVASDALVIAAPSGMYFVSGSRPRLPTRITLFTEAMSHLPRYQFAHTRFIPLSRHDLEARDALVLEHFRLAHAAYGAQRFTQFLEIYTRCDAKRKTRKIVDRTRRSAHAGGRREPHPG